MSDPLRIAFVVEGPTDFIMIKEVVKGLLAGRDFVPQVLQPEMTQELQIAPGEQGGWSRVCQWCLQSAEQGDGRLRNNPLFLIHDLLVLQLDADVAGETYGRGCIQDPYPEEQTLLCQEPCPPSFATTDRLRHVALRWMGEESTPQSTVFCTPSMALETWILVSLFPADQVAARPDVECHPDPASTLQGKPLKDRLVRSGKKDVDKYKSAAAGFAGNWSTVTDRCTEALRFETEFINALARQQSE